MAGTKRPSWSLSSTATLFLIAGCLLLSGRPAFTAPTPQEQGPSVTDVLRPTSARISSAEGDENVASYLRYKEHSQSKKTSSIETNPLGQSLRFNEQSGALNDDSIDRSGQRDQSRSAVGNIEKRSNEDANEETSDRMYNVVVNMRRREKSLYISPDVDWLRQLAPQVLNVAQETQEMIKETVEKTIEAQGRHKSILVNVINSTVVSEDEIEETLKYLNVAMAQHEGAHDQLGTPSDTQHRTFPVPKAKPLVVNIFLFNMVTNTSVDSENDSPSYSAELETYLPNSHSYVSSPRPPSAMEMAYLASHSSNNVHDHSYDSDSNSQFDSLVVEPITANVEDNVAFKQTEPQPPSPPIVQAVSAPATVTQSNGISNRMKAIGFSAIPAVAGLATTWQFWWPAVAALGRKKRSIGATSPVSRAIDPHWLSILMGERYTNSSKQDLKATVHNWRNRGKLNGTNSENPPTTLRSTTKRSIATSTSSEYKLGETTARSSESRSPSSTNSQLDDESTPRSDGWKTTNHKLWYHAMPEMLTDTQSESNAKPVSYSLLPSLSSSSGDFDIVANFVKSTLSKMVDAPETDSTDEQSFVFNTPSLVNSTDATEAVQEPERSTSQSLPLTSVAAPITSSSAASITSSSAAPSQSPITMINVFTGAAEMPVLPNSVTNSPVTFVTVRPSTLINVNQAIEEEAALTNSVTPTTTGEKSSTTKRSTDFLGEATPVDEEDIESVTGRGTESIYDDESITTSTVIEFYDEETGTTYIAKEIPMPTPAYPDGYERVTSKRPLPEPFYIDPNEIPIRVRPTSATVANKRPTGSTPPVGLVTSTSATPSTANLVTIQSFLSSQSSTNPSSSLPPEKVVTTQDPETEATVMTTLKFPHGGYVVETTAPPSEPSLLVSDVVSTQQMIDNLLKVYGTSSIAPITSQRPSTPLVTEASEAETAEYDADYYEDTTGMPMSSFNLTDFYTTYTPTPEDGDLDILALFNQLQSNLTTGLLGSSTASGIHFVNTSTDIIILSHLDGATPSSVVEIEPLDESPFVTAASTPEQIPQIEAVVAEESPLAIEPVIAGDPLSVVVEAAPSLDGAPEPSVPDVSSNANIFIGSSGGTPVELILAGTTSSSTSSTSSSLSGVGFALFAITLAAAAYVGAVLLPFWLPVALKKKRRRNFYAPARNSFQAPATVPASIIMPQPPQYQDHSLTYSDIYENVGPTGNEKNYGPSTYHGNYVNQDKRRRRVMRH